MLCINEHSNDYEPSIQQLETLCSKDHDGWVFVLLKVPTNAQKSLLKQWNAGVVVDNQDHVLMYMTSLVSDLRSSERK